MRLLFFPIPFLVGLAILGVCIFILWRRRTDRKKIISASIFGLYLLLLAGGIIFPIPVTADTGKVITWANILDTLQRVDLQLFHMGGEIYDETAHALLNLLMTLPFGFLINFITRLKPRDFIWVGLVVGCATELSQLLASILVVGAAYRSVDINDMILNMVGVWTGYGIFILLSQIPRVGNELVRWR